MRIDCSQAKCHSCANLERHIDKHHVCNKIEAVFFCGPPTYAMWEPVEVDAVIEPTPPAGRGE